MDKGPWTVEFDRADSVWCLQSEDFTHDVRLYVSGDFRDANQGKQYAEWLAAKLNNGAAHSAGSAYEPTGTDADYGGDGLGIDRTNL